MFLALFIFFVVWRMTSYYLDLHGNDFVLLVWLASLVATIVQAGCIIWYYLP